MIHTQPNLWHEVQTTDSTKTGHIRASIRPEAVHRRHPWMKLSSRRLAGAHRRRYHPLIAGEDPVQSAHILVSDPDRHVDVQRGTSEMQGELP
jgi:hypothetical protein